MKYARYLHTRHYYECPECGESAWIEDAVLNTDTSRMDEIECVCQFCKKTFTIFDEEVGDL